MNETHDISAEFKAFDDGETISLQRVWLSLGGNPKLVPTRTYVDYLMKLAVEAMDHDNDQLKKESM